MSARGLAVLIALAACYDARPFPGAPCASNGACPSGLVCAGNGRCEVPGGGPIDAAADASGIDAPIDGGSGSGSGGCSAPPSYSPGAFGSSQYADNYPETGSSDHEEYWNGYLTSAANPDELGLDFFGYDGAFGASNDIHTGTFTIGSSPDDTSYAACGLCGIIGTQISGSGVATSEYFWSSGTVTLTSVNGTLSGTLSNLVFRQVDYDGSNNQTDDPSGCMTTIGNASFSATLQTITSGVVAPSTPHHIHIQLHPRRD